MLPVCDKPLHTIKEYLPLWAELTNLRNGALWFEAGSHGPGIHKHGLVYDYLTLTIELNIKRFSFNSHVILYPAS